MTAVYEQCNGCGELIAVDREAIEAVARADAEEAGVDNVYWRACLRHRDHAHAMQIWVGGIGGEDFFIDEMPAPKTLTIYGKPLEPFGPDYWDRQEQSKEGKEVCP